MGAAWRRQSSRPCKIHLSAQAQRPTLVFLARVAVANVADVVSSILGGDNWVSGIAANLNALGELLGVELASVNMRCVISLTVVFTGVHIDSNLIPLDGSAISPFIFLIIAIWFILSGVLSDGFG